MTDPTIWPAPFDPHHALACLPTALVWLTTDGALGWCNAAARRALGPAACEPGARLEQAFEANPPLEDGALVKAMATGAWLRVRRAPAAPGAWLTLEAADELVRVTDEGERCREFLNLAQDFGRLGVWRRNPVTLEALWDDHVFALWGMTPAPEVPALQVTLDAVLPEDRSRAFAEFQRSMITPGLHSLRFRVRHANGDIRRLHSRWEVKPGDDVHVRDVYGVLVDETDAWKQAQTHQRTESQMALAEASAGIARWVTDLGLKRLFYDRQASEMFGLPFRPDGMPVDEFRSTIVHPDDLAALAEAGERAIRTGETTEVETRYRMSDGSVRRVLTRRQVQRDEAGAPQALIGIAIDLTVKRQAELDLMRASERLAMVARGVGLGTWEADADSGETHWDAQMWRLRGREPRAAAPHEDERLAMVHPDDRVRSRAIVKQVFAGKEVAEHSFRVIWPDGSVHWIASRGGPLLDSDGKVLRRMGVNWDVTAARQADEERRARELAQQASQAKNEFLSRMSHELRTPLNAVIGFSQLLLERHAHPDDPERQQLAAVLNGGQHLLALVNDVLELTSLDGGHLRIERVAVDLSALLRQTLSMVEPMRVSQGIAPFEVDLQPVSVLADPTRLRQVLINLLSNAIKYNRRGGQVRLSTWVDDAQGLLRVSDTGRGLSTEQLSHLFEPFNRLGVEAQGIEGTGIGLTITKALVERMGGSVDVTSQPGTGSCFRISLPVAAAPSIAEPEARLAATPMRGGSVLYIEDNAVNMMLMEEILARVEGLRLHKAVDGRSGVAAALRHRPDLVLIDMQLPDADGLDVLRRLQADPATAGLPCIAVSANAMPEDIARARQAGFIDYWTKPLDLMAVVGMVEQHLVRPGRI